MKNPMLLANDPYDLQQLDFTKDRWFNSIKRDGVRFEISNKGLLGRSLKHQKNETQLNKYFKSIFENLPNGVVLEAELYKHGLNLNEITPYCNSKDKPICDGMKLYIFGFYDMEATFEERISMLNKVESFFCNEYDKYEIVEQVKMDSYEEVMNFYQGALTSGYEGAVLMNGSGMYKEGRISVKRQVGYKLKPYKYEDLPILGTTERMLNTNESQTNELGHSFKRNTVDAKELTGIAACFICKLRDAKPDEKLIGDDKEYGCITTKVTITGDEESRRKIWGAKESYIGKYAVVLSMAYGQKNKLRHATLLKIKEQCEK